MENSTAPKSVGIIMDGNRRWAKENELHKFEGHKAGLEKIKEVLQWIQDTGISEVTFYAFSSENWSRAEDEVGEMMRLVEYAFGAWMDEVVQKGIRIRIIGDRTKFSQKIQELFLKAEESTKSGDKGTLIFALSYGGRSEIIAAANSAMRSGVTEITEESLRANMWSHDLQDPELIIRTGGDKRLSNFLTWQSVYSELFFIDTKWPAFSKEEFFAILEEYSGRERRHGK